MGVRVHCLYALHSSSVDEPRSAACTLLRTFPSRLYQQTNKTSCDTTNYHVCTYALDEIDFARYNPEPLLFTTPRRLFLLRHTAALQYG